VALFLFTRAEILRRERKSAWVIELAMERDQS